MPTPNVRGHQVPTNLEHPSRQGWVLNPLLSINDIVMAANQTDRFQKLADIGSSAARPLLIRQQDTDEFWEHNGTAWKLLFAPVVTAVLTYAAGLYGPITNEPITLYRRGDDIYMTGRGTNIINFPGGLAQGTQYQLGTIPAGFRPDKQKVFPLTGGLNAAIVPGYLVVGADGVVQYALGSGAASVTAGGAWVTAFGEWERAA